MFMPAAIFADINYTVNGIKYVLRTKLSNAEAEKYQCETWDDIFIVVGYTSIPSDGKVSIPRSIRPSDYGYGDPNTYNVLGIGAEAFKNCKDLTSVSLPDGLIEIEEDAFNNCSSLTSITIPNSVLYVRSGAFARCSSLTSAKLSNKQTELAAGTFSGCTSLTSVSIPYSITSFSNAVFQNCSNLSKIHLPILLSSIGSYAFFNCISLSSIEIPGGVKTIGSYAFQNTPITSIVLPNNLTSIEDGVFQNCNQLTSISIPNKIKSIGSYAFKDCYNLTDVDIPNTITSIGQSAFRNCKSLKSIALSKDLEIIENYAFEGDSNLLYIDFPAKLKRIDGFAFKGCKRLTYVYTNQVDTIGSGAFKNCSGLTYLVIDSLKKIENSSCQVFKGCINLASITYLGNKCPYDFFGAFDNIDIPLYMAYKSLIDDLIDEYSLMVRFSMQLVEWAYHISSAETKTYPAKNSVKLEWPNISEARIYAIDLYAEGDSVHSLVFDNRGQLLLNKLTPYNRNKENTETLTSTTATSGLQFTINNLQAGKEYTYKITAYDKENHIIYNTSDKFSTDKGEGIEDIRVDSEKTVKVLMDGKIYILRGEHVYDAQGKIVK